MTNVLELATAFYDSVWDFSTRVILLTDHFKEDGGTGINPQDMLKDFKQRAMPFLDLQGDNLPANVLILFDQIDETMREELFPGYDVLVEEWDDLKSREESLTKDDMLVFAEKIALWVNQMEMYVIAQTSNLIAELKLQPQPI